MADRNPQVEGPLPNILQLPTSLPGPQYEEGIENDLKKSGTSNEALAVSFRGC